MLWSSSVFTLPAIFIYGVSILVDKVWSTIRYVCFPGLYYDKVVSVVRIGMLKSSILDELRNNKIQFSIGKDYIGFPSMEEHKKAQPFLGSVK